MGLGFARVTRGRQLIGMIERLIFKAPSRTLTGNATLTVGDSGTTFLIGAADLVVTLPPTVKGVRYRFTLTSAGLSSSTGLSVSPDSNDKIMGNGLTGVNNKDLILGGGGDREGDSVEIEGDGVDGWFINTAIGTFSIQG